MLLNDLVDDPATLGRLNEALEAILNKAQVGKEIKNW